MNLFSLTCEHGQGAKMASDSMKIIVLDSSDGLIVQDQRIKTRDGWVAGVDFVQEDLCEKAHAVNENEIQMKFQKKKDI